MDLIGSVVKPQKFKCGGWTGCEHDHDFFAPEDVLILHQAITYEDLHCDETWTQQREDNARTHKTLYFGDKGVVPTMLGIWWDDCSVN